MMCDMTCNLITTKHEQITHYRNPSFKHSALIGSPSHNSDLQCLQSSVGPKRFGALHMSISWTHQPPVQRQKEFISSIIPLLLILELKK